MQLECKNCGAPIPVENINLGRAIAKCTKCNAVFGFADRFPEANLAKPTVSQPEKIQLVRSTNELTFARKWFSPVFFFLAFFSLFWNGIVWTMALVAIFSKNYFMLVFMSLHLTIGLVILYFAAALLVNSTEVRVDRRYLSVKNTPLPFPRNIPLPVPGNRTVPVGRIDQIYCKEKIAGRGFVNYELHALDDRNQRQKLIKGIPNAEEAAFLEQEIESFLGITDRPVRGEYIP